MRILYGPPPMYGEIIAKFPKASLPGTIFAWGETIYYRAQPGSTLPDYLIAHEGIHQLRQGNDIEGWWRRYIDDVDFRLGEEIAAHLAELKVRLVQGESRPHRRWIVGETAKRLGSALYQWGPLMNARKAEKLLRAITTG